MNSNGTITLDVETATDVVVSVTGFWQEPAANDTGLGLKVLDAPERLVDTTDGTGTCNGLPCTTLPASTEVVVPVVGQVGLDDDVSAVLVSVTLSDPAGPGLLGIGPSGAAPAGGFLYDAGDVLSASFIVPVDRDTGTVTVTSWVAAELAVDVVGFFSRPTRTYRYFYDSSGNRVAKELEKADGSGVEWRREHTWSYVYGGPVLLAEHAGTESSYVVHGPGGQPIYQQNRTGEVMYLHHDHQGSTRLVTHANGTVRGSITYDGQGSMVGNTNPIFQEQPLIGYVAQFLDTETTYLVIGGRHYDPGTGTFTGARPNSPAIGPAYSPGGAATIGSSRSAQVVVDWVKSTCGGYAKAAGCAAFVAAIASLALGVWAFPGIVAGGKGVAAAVTASEISTWLGLFALAVQVPVTVNDCSKGVDGSCFVNVVASLLGAVSLGTGLFATKIVLSRPKTWWDFAWYSLSASVGSGVIGTGFGAPGVSGRADRSGRPGSEFGC